MSSRRKKSEVQKENASRVLAWVLGISVTIAVLKCTLYALGLDKYHSQSWWNHHSSFLYVGDVVLTLLTIALAGGCGLAVGSWVYYFALVS